MIYPIKSRLKTQFYIHISIKKIISPSYKLTFPEKELVKDWASNLQLMMNIKNTNHVTFFLIYFMVTLFHHMIPFLFIINDFPPKQRREKQNEKEIKNKFPGDHIHQPLLIQEQDLNRLTAARQPRIPVPTGRSG